MKQLSFVEWFELRIRISLAEVSLQIEQECDTLQQPYDYEEEEHYAEQAEFSIASLRDDWGVDCTS